MKQMQISELEEILQKYTNSTISFNLTGVITTTIQVNFTQIKSNEQEIIIENQKNSKEKIKLNKHQIMKIEEENEKILINFDNLQMVEILAKV